ncbi:hypothetical protein [Herbidospora galbida]|nr:hypothetical protein [Herbidospora galbida]
MNIAIDTCYNHEGVHYPGYYCPHGEKHDEMGPVMDEGWTVQQQ